MHCVKSVQSVEFFLVRIFLYQDFVFRHFERSDNNKINVSFYANKILEDNKYRTCSSVIL